MNAAKLQERIDAAALELSAADDPKARRKAWKKMQRLIAKRSPETVRQMEVEKFGESFSA